MPTRPTHHSDPTVFNEAQQAEWGGTAQSSVHPVADNDKSDGAAPDDIAIEQKNPELPPRQPSL
ncbi:MAG: hypothetical protein QM639_08505 [Rhodocyclaceae bacterium]